MMEQERKTLAPIQEEYTSLKNKIHHTANHGLLADLVGRSIKYDSQVEKLRSTMLGRRSTIAGRGAFHNDLIAQQMKNVLERRKTLNNGNTCAEQCQHENNFSEDLKSQKNESEQKDLSDLQSWAWGGWKAAKEDLSQTLPQSLVKSKQPGGENPPQKEAAASLRRRSITLDFRAQKKEFVIDRSKTQLDFQKAIRVK